MAFYYNYGTENASGIAPGSESKPEEMTQPREFVYIPPGHPSRQPFPLPPPPPPPPPPLPYYNPFYPRGYYPYNFHQPASPAHPYTNDPNAQAYYAYPRMTYPVVSPPTAPQPVYHFPYPAGHQAHVQAGTPFLGPTREEVEARDRAAGEATGASKPQLMVPMDTDPSGRYWVKEKDGAFTLRSLYDIQERLKPGEGGVWVPGQSEGTFYFKCT